MKRPQRRGPFPLAVLLAAAALAAVAPAQRTERRNREDIEFARGLATDWGFVDMAERLLQEVEDSRPGAELREDLGLARCDMYAAAAQQAREAGRRHELYRKALDAYLDFLAQNPFADKLQEAQLAYVNLANQYGEILAFELEDLYGEEAEAQRETIRDVLEEAVKLSNELAGELEDIEQLSAEDERVLYGLQLANGKMRHQLARVADDGSYHFARAEETLENLALAAGELSGWGLRAYLELGEVKASQGEWRDAAAFLDFVVEKTIPQDQEVWRQTVEEGGISRAEQDYRWYFVEWATAGLIEAWAKAGKPDEAMQGALHFYNTWQREGFTISRPGYLSLLAVARFLLDAGGYLGVENDGTLRWFASDDAASSAGYRGRRAKSTTDQALSIAEQVNRENRLNIVGVRAQKLIATAIERPGVQVAPDVLFEAAQGEYYDQEFPAALAAYRRVLSALGARDEATRTEFGAKVMNQIGRTFERMNRPLEAAMAYREAVDNWEDPAFNLSNAEGFYRAISEVRRGAPDDPMIDELWKEAENDVVTHTSEGDAGEIVYRQALRLYNDTNFDAARAKFREIDPASSSSEQGRVFAALCLYREGQKAAARAELEQYLAFTQDPVNEIPPNDAKALANRGDARALANFYIGRIAAETASEPAEFEEAVELLSDYPERFPDQKSYGADALYMTLRVQLEQLEDHEAAKATLARMLEKYPESERTGISAVKVYGVLSDERAATEAEAERSALTREMANYLSIGNDLSRNPSFVNLRQESKLWLELEEWETAEQVLRALVAKFEDDEARASDIQNFVLPDLAHALLRQRRAREAFEVLDALVPKSDAKDDDRKPSASTVIDYCRSVSGWVEGSGSSIIEVPGVGGEENFDNAWSWWLKLTSASDSWTCEWYGRKFEMAYTGYQWGLIDSKKLQYAEEVIAPLRSETGANYALVVDACGDDVLRSRLVWLDSKLP